MIAVVVNSMQTRGKLNPISNNPNAYIKSITYTRRQMAPALLWVAFFKIAKSGPAEDSLMAVMSPATKSRTIRKMNPVIVPIATHAIIILGPSTEGLGISVIR